MKTRSDINWNFIGIVYDYGMYDNLTQAEIDELVAISENTTFCTLLKRHDVLQEKICKTKASDRVPYYQLMRPTVVLMATHLEKQLAACRGLRVRVIVAGYLRTILDKMEYHTNIYRWRFVNLIKAFPNLSDAELAKYCIANKIAFTADPKHDSDWLVDMLESTRKGISASSSVATVPITIRESIYAARWIEIFERQK